MSIWGQLRHFTIDEKWGDPNKMNGLLLILLDHTRDLYGNIFTIHCGYATTGHSPKSQHYLGNAVDFHIVSDEPFADQVRRLLQIFDLLQVSDRIGLGIYPEWSHPGFHLDVRGRKARWGRIQGRYVSFETAFRSLDL